MKKGQRNIKILDIEDAEKAYQKLFNLVLNGEIDNKKGRTLLAILNGRVQAYKVTNLEAEIQEIKDIIYNNNNGNDYEEFDESEVEL